MSLIFNLILIISNLNFFASLQFLLVLGTRDVNETDIFRPYSNSIRFGWVLSVRSRFQIFSNIFNNRFLLVLGTRDANDMDIFRSYSNLIRFGRVFIHSYPIPDIQ